MKLLESLVDFHLFFTMDIIVPNNIPSGNTPCTSILLNNKAEYDDVV